MTDHRAEAENHIDRGYVEVAVSLPLAQVHATLALVEAVNTLALISYLPLATVNGHENSQRGIVRALIEERLGLK